MKSKNKSALLILTVLMLLLWKPLQVQSWGFWGHQRINRIAVFTLPPGMISFYKENIEYITKHAVDPDMRRYSDPKEAPRHYIDLDNYGEYPFSEVPRYWKDAVAKYTENTLNEHGIVPWHVNLMIYKLTDAFKEKNKRRILHLSADIGHYIADANVPLHCTSNYNGQKTNQVGIHGFWESRIPELFGENYDFFVGKAEYIDKPQEEIWKVVLGSAIEVDSVLSFEKTLSETFPADKKYSFAQKGNNTVRAYSPEYSKAYEKMLAGMVERKMRNSIITIGSFWYTAWVNAGKPDLSQLKNTQMSLEEEQELKEMDKAWKEGKILGRAHDD
jgi:hypothetical protein